MTTSALTSLLALEREHDLERRPARPSTTSSSPSATGRLPSGPGRDPRLVRRGSRRLAAPSSAPC